MTCSGFICFTLLPARLLDRDAGLVSELQFVEFGTFESSLGGRCCNASICLCQLTRIITLVSILSRPIRRMRVNRAFAHFKSARIELS